MKVLLRRLHLNGHTTGFQPQTQKLYIIVNVSITDSESKRVKKLYPIQQHFLGHNSETLIHLLQRFTPPYHSSCFWSAEDKVRIMTWILLSGQTRELQSGVAL